MPAPDHYGVAYAAGDDDDGDVQYPRLRHLRRAARRLVPELNAWAAALPAAVTGTDFSATSTSSVTIGTGAKSFTIQTGKQFQVGQTVRIAYTATPANLHGRPGHRYNSGTGALVVDVQAVGGAGTLALWTISLIPGGAARSRRWPARDADQQDAHRADPRDASPTAARSRCRPARGR
jgi:hypothetical protein